MTTNRTIFKHVYRIDHALVSLCPNFAIPVKVSAIMCIPIIEIREVAYNLRFPCVASATCFRTEKFAKS